MSNRVSGLPDIRFTSTTRQRLLKAGMMGGTMLACFMAGMMIKREPVTPDPGTKMTQPVQDTFSKTPSQVTEELMFPPIKPFRTQMLQVSPLHKIYVEESGNPSGYPVFYLHGGPAAGLGDDYRQFFDPRFFHIIGFDQRGAERSQPLGELRENTTWDLVEDIQKIRKALGIENKKYLLFGGSWGSLLALAAAEKNPEDVEGLIVLGISLGRPNDTIWSTLPGRGIFNIYPEAGDYLARFLEGKQFSEEDIRLNRDPVLGVFDRLFNDPDVSEEDRLLAVKYWRLGSTYATEEELKESEKAKPLEAYRENIHTARIVCRYYYMNAFMDPPDQLIKDVHRLKTIPHIFIINGREDINTPPKRAYDLHKALQQEGIPHGYKIMEGAGHSAWNPLTQKELSLSLRAFQKRIESETPKHK